MADLARGAPAGTDCRLKVPRGGGAIAIAQRLLESLLKFACSMPPAFAVISSGEPAAIRYECHDKSEGHSADAVCDRRTVLRLFGLAALGGVAGPALSQSGYPSGPIRLIVPFAAGGAADAVARLVAEQLSLRLGQAVIVENRTGASGNIGTELVAKSEPDGRTLLLGFDGTLVINPFISTPIPFDPVADFHRSARSVMRPSWSLPIRNCRSEPWRNSSHCQRANQTASRTALRASAARSI